MTLTFAGGLDRGVLGRAVDAVADLVGSAEVAAAWSSPSSLPGMSVGGLSRHLVSQPECAVEFVSVAPPVGAEPVTLLEWAERLDWLDAPIGAPENTSICADFDAMAAGGPAESVEVLRRASVDLPAALAAAAPTTWVPWQECSLALDDFLVCRLVEVVVHADYLAVSVDLPTPRFDDEAVGPVLTLLTALSARRHGPGPVLRALARTERAGSSVSAFG